MTIKEVVKIFRKACPDLVPNRIFEYEQFYLINFRGAEQSPGGDYFTGTKCPVIWKDSKRVEWLEITKWGPIVRGQESLEIIDGDELERYNK